MFNRVDGSGGRCIATRSAARTYRFASSRFVGRRWGLFVVVPVGILRAAAALACVGDCSGDGAVTVTDLIRCVDIDLGVTDLSTCPACSVSGQSVQVTDLVVAVDNALNGCVTPTPTGASTPTVTAAVRPTETPVITATEGPRPTATATSQSSATQTVTAAPMPSVTKSPTRTATVTAGLITPATRTPTRTASARPSATRSKTATNTRSPRPSATPTRTATGTRRPTATTTATLTRSATLTATITPTPGPTLPPTASIEVVSSECGYFTYSADYLYQKHQVTVRVRGPVGVSPLLTAAQSTTGCFLDGECEEREPCLTCDDWTGMWIAYGYCPEGNGIRQAGDSADATCTITEYSGQDYGADSYFSPGPHTFTVRFFSPIGVFVPIIAHGEMICPSPMDPTPTAAPTVNVPTRTPTLIPSIVETPTPVPTVIVQCGQECGPDASNCICNCGCPTNFCVTAVKSAECQLVCAPFFSSLGCCSDLETCPHL